MIEHHRSFGVHDGRASQSAFDRFEDELGIDARLARKHHRFGQSGDVERHDDLVGKLGGMPAPMLPQ